jgi:predicted GNAT family acetyltransferase
MDYGVLTDPEFRGQGLARHVVCALADDTAAGGLIPQYRCKRVNKASRRVAEAAGFTLYYTTESVKFK